MRSQHANRTVNPRTPLRNSPGQLRRVYRRAIVIYVLTIVLPVCAVLWLGIHSFERQRQALATLTNEKIAAAVESRSREAAEAAFSTRTHPIAVHFFRVDGGELVEPRLRAPLPALAPPAFADAERLELTQPALALAKYRTLLETTSARALALSRIARCLSGLGKQAEAQAAWRQLAESYPADRDLSHRPYGIVGAIQSGETAGLLQHIEAGDWELTADQAEYFISQLESGRSSRYLERFEWARKIAREFRPPPGLRIGDIREDRIDDTPIFYRAEDSGRFSIFTANPAWIEALQTRTEAEVRGTGAAVTEVRLYAGAVALVTLLLSAGAALLWRDTSRESRTNQLRADFVSGVSHELKTPITLLRLHGETLLRQRTLAEDERRDLYRVITRESTRLGRLVDQILAFSRVDRGQLAYELEEGDVAPVVTRVVDDYREWLERAGFIVTCTVPDSAPPVRFDAAAVAQALVNLLDNAAKYSGVSRHITVTLQADARAVTIQVEDGGIGIPLDEQERIFQRFYRAAVEAGKGGYGLGLFMVRHIMQAHGGRAEVESEPGRGSRFRLVFPRAAV